MKVLSRDMNKRRLAWGRRGLVIRALALGLVVVIAGLLISPSAAAEGEPPRIKSLKISVWPEYDDPRILVMYEGELGDGVPVPQGVKFLAPSGSEITQVCAIQKPRNEHLCQVYQAREEEGYLAISYTLPMPNFFLEYFYDGLGGQPERAFRYQFRASHPIDKLEIEVQQPLRSSGFNLSPAYSNVSSESQGFKYYHYYFDKVTAGQVITLNASYTKSDSQPSVSKKQPGRPESANALVLVGVAAAALLGGVGWFAFSRRRAVPQRPAVPTLAKKPKGPSQRPPTPGYKPEMGRAFFCSHCGLPLEESPNFCPRCGTKVRKHV